MLCVIAKTDFVVEVETPITEVTCNMSFTDSGRQRHRYKLIKVSLTRDTVPVMPGEYSEREPPDSISNSEVKTFSADDSVGFPHVKVGHCQAFNKIRLSLTTGPFFITLPNTILLLYHHRTHV